MTDSITPGDCTPSFRDYGVCQEVIDDTLAFILEYEDVFKALAENDLLSLVEQVDIAEIVLELCARHPQGHELSNERLVKLVYLCDWLSCQRHGKQLTEIEWYFHEYGPYVSDVIDSIKDDDRFIVSDTPHPFYSRPKLLIQAKDVKAKSKLPREAQKVVQSVVGATNALYWNELQKYVYATYPIRQSDRYSSLDLVNFAREERSHCKRASTPSRWIEADTRWDYLCDWCFEPATVLDTEFDQVTRQVTTIHCWCDRHEYWWQRAIYELRKFWEGVREDGGRGR